MRTHAWGSVKSVDKFVECSETHRSQEASRSALCSSFSVCDDPTMSELAPTPKAPRICVFEQPNPTLNGIALGILNASSTCSSQRPAPSPAASWISEEDQSTTTRGPPLAVCMPLTIQGCFCKIDTRHD